MHMMNQQMDASKLQAGMMAYEKESMKLELGSEISTR
jgi:hypothetical protein